MKVTSIASARPVLWALKRIALALEPIARDRVKLQSYRRCGTCDCMLAQERSMCPICGGKP